MNSSQIRPLAQSVVALLPIFAASVVLADEPRATVSAVAGVKQDPVEQVKPVIVPGVPRPNSSQAQRANKVDGVATVDGVEATGQAAPIPPPPPEAHASAAAAVAGVATIQPVNGVVGIRTPKMQNLEAALILKEGGAGTPVGGAEHGGKGKSAAAALLSAPLGKPAPKIGPKEDGRGGFQEFEKLQNRGS